MNYSEGPFVVKDVINLTIALLALLNMSYLDLLKENFYNIITAIFTGFLSAISIISFVYIERTKNSIERIIFNPFYLDTENKAYDLWRWVYSFNLEIFFKYISFKDIDEKLKSQFRDNKSEKETYELAFNRLKKSFNIFKNFICYTFLLLFICLACFFTYPLFADIQLFFYLVIISIIILSFYSLFYLYKLIRILFWGDKDEEELIKTKIKDIFKILS